MSGISIYACSNPQTVVTVEMTAGRSEVGLHNLTSVSYTHLDVYKRQVIRIVLHV